MPEIKQFENLESDILAALNADTEMTLPELLASLQESGNTNDDVFIRMALWPLISQHKIELTRGLNLRRRSL